MKKALYIFSFILFGLILATIVHAILELVALQIIFGNPEQFANTAWWRQWHFIHGAASNFLWLVGLIAGGHYGFKYWEPYGSKPGFYHWKKKYETSTG